MGCGKIKPPRNCVAVLYSITLKNFNAILPRCGIQPLSYEKCYALQ